MKNVSLQPKSPTKIVESDAKAIPRNEAAV